MAVFSFPSKKRKSLQDFLEGLEGFEYIKAMTADSMLEEARRFLSKGQREKSLTLIRKAKEKMLLEYDTDIQDLLSLPCLLQEAGRKNEAWMLFMEIKEYAYQKWDREDQPNYRVMAEESSISKAMSDFLQQEKKLGYSFYLAVKSYLEDATSTFYLMNATMQKEITEKNPAIKAGYVQARKQSESYMNIKISESYIKNVLYPYLYKNNRLDRLNDVLALIKDYISHIPRIDYIKLEEDLLQVMRPPSKQH